MSESSLLGRLARRVTELQDALRERDEATRQRDEARQQLHEMRVRHNKLAVQFSIVERERDHYRNAWLEDVAMLKKAGRSE